MATLTQALPAQRIDSTGKSHVDYRAVWGLAAPLMANSSVQAVLNLTDNFSDPNVDDPDLSPATGR